jgi:hypothetical protein
MRARAVRVRVQLAADLGRSTDLAAGAGAAYRRELPRHAVAPRRVRARTHEHAHARTHPCGACRCRAALPDDPAISLQIALMSEDVSTPTSTPCRCVRALRAPAVPTAPSPCDASARRATSVQDFGRPDAPGFSIPSASLPSPPSSLLAGRGRARARGLRTGVPLAGRVRTCDGDGDAYARFAVHERPPLCCAGGGARERRAPERLPAARADGVGRRYSHGSASWSRRPREGWG